jgi:hypothetical protein
MPLPNLGGGDTSRIWTVKEVFNMSITFVEENIPEHRWFKDRFELVEESKMQVDKIYYNTSSDKYYKLLAIISGQGYLFQRYSHLTGKLYEGQGKKMFIPNEEFVQARWKEYTPKQSGTVWVNVYGNVGRLSAVAHNSKEVANEEAGKNRLACVKVDWVEGQGL